MNWSSGSRLEELAGLGVEVVELALEDRDHVPGDVLETSGFSSDPLRPLGFASTEVGSMGLLAGLGVRANIAKRGAEFRYLALAEPMRRPPRPIL